MIEVADVGRRWRATFLRSALPSRASRPVDDGLRRRSMLEPRPFASRRIDLIHRAFRSGRSAAPTISAMISAADQLLAFFAVSNMRLQRPSRTIPAARRRAGREAAPFLRRPPNGVLRQDASPPWRHLRQARSHCGRAASRTPFFDAEAVGQLGDPMLDFLKWQAAVAEDGGRRPASCGFPRNNAR